MNSGEFKIKNPNWREDEENLKGLVFLDNGLKTTEYEVLLAVEMMTPITLKKYNRYPRVEDITAFINMIRGE